MAEFDIASITIAVISACISLLSLYITRNHNTELEKLKGKLAIEKDEQGAIRDYEYEARKRMYQEFEPILFLLVEHSESAIFRIFEIARAGRNGKLEPNVGWFGGNGEGYIFSSTIYRLLLPLAVFRLMQRKLTIYDLDLVSSYKIQYLLSKQLYTSFSRDFDLAEYQPVLDYNPYKASQQDIDAFPEKYRKQGIYANLVDSLAL